MNISKRVRICAALAKTQQDVQHIQTKGVLNSAPEMEQLRSGLMGVMQARGNAHETDK